MGQNENPLVWPAATRLFDNVSQDCATPECLHIRLAMCLSYTRSVRPERARGRGAHMHGPPQ